MRLRRVACGVGVLLASACVLSHGSAGAQGRDAKSTGTLPASGSAAPPVVGGTDRVVLVADLDDDDLDDQADGLAESVAPAARVDLLALEARYAGATLVATRGAEHARVVAGGKPVPWGERLPAGAMLQGISAGHVSLVVEQGKREWALALDVHAVGARDGAKKPVDLTKDRASLERTPPARVDLDDADRSVDDPDALRFVTTSPEGTSLGAITVDSISADGMSLDVLRDVKVSPVPCDKAAEPGLTCAATAPIRLVVDDVDRSHPLVVSRSVRAEVGGAIVVRDETGRKLQAIRVAGPRASSVGPIGRHRLTIHPVVMRLTSGGAPAVGGTDAGAIASIRQELALASATWGQCGISFGPVTQMDVKVVNPPPPYLVAIGDDVGLPASGGEVRLKVDGRPVGFTTKKGWSTRQVALELQRAAERLGLKATLSENARISPGAAPSVDVAMRRIDGQFASVELVSSSDATLSVTVGAVDLTDGLQHFGDTDSVAGTLEERALVKAVDDGDPRTVELIVVPFFSGGGRIGESFISSDGSSMRNVVIIDRAGVRARRTSLTLAHELGHVILDEPGHPDDYGVDTPTLLMDSDAADSSPFGPRRLTTEECARAVRQSGPRARLPLLTEWKLGPMRLGR
ncbi:MAG: hypothetical protein JST00_22955 [Deltaproteobacteria bacterium]|nr:hypothetical protein [Deltaproteobacteria bacterium]